MDQFCLHQFLAFFEKQRGLVLQSRYLFSLTHLPLSTSHECKPFVSRILVQLEKKEQRDANEESFLSLHIHETLLLIVFQEVNQQSVKRVFLNYVVHHTNFKESNQGTLLKLSSKVLPCKVPINRYNLFLQSLWI